jgi:hypothetical protein
VQDKLDQIDDIIQSIISDTRKLGSDPIDYPNQFRHGWWDCNTSPTKYCMYTIDLDCCIFCEEPDERK